MSSVVRILVLFVTATALGLAARPSTAATIGLNFTGARQGAFGSSVPDTDGAVGRNHIVEILNGVYTVYDKATGRQLQRMSLDTFWFAAGRRGPESITGPTCDPRVIYDAVNDRWYSVAVECTGDVPNHIYLGVSISSEPTFPSADLSRGWRGFVVDGDPTSEPNTRWSDYPTIGMSGDSVQLSANLRDVAGGPVVPIGNYVVSIPKADVVAANPTLANRSVFAIEANRDLGGAFTAIQPILEVGASTGPTQLFAVNPRSGLKQWDILNAGVPTPGGAQITGPTDIPIPAFSIPPSGDQPGTGSRLFNLGPANYAGVPPNMDAHRFSSNLFKQGSSAWGAHIVDSDGRSGVRWYQVDVATHQLMQWGTITDPSLDLLFPSIAANLTGDVVIGFTATGEQKFPSAFAAVGQTVAGLTTFGDLMELKAGAGSYSDGNSISRWGDYSMTVIDPVDPLRFWTFQEFTYTDDDVGVQWAVQISEIIIPEPSTLALGIATCGLLSMGLVLRRRRRCD